MGTRTIIASISKNSNTDLKGDGYASFSVTSDTGAVSGAQITEAVLLISSCRTYTSGFYLNVKFDSNSNSTRAYSDSPSSNSSSHSEELDLNDLDEELLTETPSSIYLVVDGSNTNKINFRSGCTITLIITYEESSSGGGDTSSVTAPTLVTVNGSTSMISTSSSTITLSWSGATGEIWGYFIQYVVSSDGYSWGGWQDWDATTSTSVTIEIGNVGEYIKYRIWAYGDNSVYSATAAESPIVYRTAGTLPVAFNGTTLTKIIYNGVEITSLVYNGNTLF